MNFQAVKLPHAFVAERNGDAGAARHADADCESAKPRDRNVQGDHQHQGDRRWLFPVTLTKRHPTQKLVISQGALSFIAVRGSTPAAQTF